MSKESKQDINICCIIAEGIGVGEKDFSRFKSCPQVNSDQAPKESVILSINSF